mmetsp:Transcript_23111/g.59385  ORF Transcript_23111/g.59385 Transcript_23111/m.59385 type:complete len:566 (+) Transcript_23111:3-1700(+)
MNKSVTPKNAARQRAPIIIVSMGRLPGPGKEPGAVAAGRRARPYLALGALIVLVQLHHLARSWALLSAAHGTGGLDAVRRSLLRRSWLPRTWAAEDEGPEDDAEMAHWRRVDQFATLLLGGGGAKSADDPSERADVALVSTLDGHEDDGGGAGGRDGHAEGEGSVGADGEADDGAATEADAEAEAEDDASMDSLVRSMEGAATGAGAAFDEDDDDAKKKSGAEELGGVSITLVSQTSEERIWMIEHMCDRWPGALAIGVHVRGDPHKVMATHRRVEKFGACVSDGEMRLSLEVMHAARRDEAYPINKLRNLAISRVATTHFLIVDIDLWPSAELYNVLMYAMAHDTPVEVDATDAAGGATTDEAGGDRALTLKDLRLAIVAPAFEISGSAFGLAGQALAPKVPRTFAQLQECHGKGNCHVFKKTTHTHRSTDYARWWEHTGVGAYQIKCFDSIRYEPYVVVPTDHATTPRFDERFSGYGKNKIQFIQHLRMAGFRFAVITRGFVVHVAHEKSRAYRAWLATRSSKRAKTNDVFQQFIAERMASAKVVTPLCKQAFSHQTAIMMGQ